MMKFLFYILLFTLNYSCNGQEKSEPKKQELLALSAVQEYQKQEHQFEFKSHQMYYNTKQLKLGTIANSIKLFGKPDIEYPDLVFYNNPLNIFVNDITKTDKFGRGIIEYNGKEYTLLDSKGNTISDVLDIYLHKGGKYSKKRNTDGILLGNVDTYRIWMSPYETMSIVPNKEDSAKAKIPALNGYIKINGKLIHQSIRKKELVEKLKPMPEGSQILGMLGDPVLIYDLGDKAKDFDPNLDPDDPKVFIDIVFKIDPKTKEEKGIYYINYYYSLKDK